MPDLLAVQIETINTRFAEEDVEIFTIAGGRARRIAMLALGATGAVPGFRQEGLEVPGPEDVPFGAVDTHEVPHEPVHVPLSRFQAIAGVAGEVDTFADHDRAGSPGSG